MCVYSVYSWAHVPHCTCGGQMQALKSWFSPFTFLWTLGMRSGHQACAASPFPPWSCLSIPRMVPTFKRVHCVCSLSALLGSGLQEPTSSLQAITQGPYSVLFVLNFQALWARMSSAGMFVS